MDRLRWLHLRRTEEGACFVQLQDDSERLRRIINAIAELESNGLARRNWLMAGRYLALCQNCQEACWRKMAPGTFAEFLTSSEFCERWAELHREE